MQKASQISLKTLSVTKHEYLKTHFVFVIMVGT